MIEFRRGQIFTCPYEGMEMIVLGVVDSRSEEVQNRVIVAEVAHEWFKGESVMTYFQHELEGDI